MNRSNALPRLQVHRRSSGRDTWSRKQVQPNGWNYCRRAVRPGEKNPTAEIVPVAPGLTAIVIDKGEQKLMDAAIMDAVASNKKYRTSPLSKAGSSTSRVRSARDTPGRMIVHLMMQAWIGRCLSKSNWSGSGQLWCKANAKLADLLSQGLYPTIEERWRRQSRFRTRRV